MAKRQVKQRQDRIEVKTPMTKEEFLIEWLLLRASFRDDFSGVSAAKAASESWEEVQKLCGNK